MYAPTEQAPRPGPQKEPMPYSPINWQPHARGRRSGVLDRMSQDVCATQAEVDAAKKEDSTLDLYRDICPDRMPYYAEHVRRYITEHYGNDALFTKGLRIETAAEPSWEAAAYENADFGARHQDKRQGWRGPEWRNDGEARAKLNGGQKGRDGTGPRAPGKGAEERLDGRGGSTRGAWGHTPGMRVVWELGTCFPVVVIVGALLGWLLARAIRAIGLGFIDRVLGAVFGVARGVLIVVIGVLLAGLTTLPRQEWWQNAFLAPPLVAAALSLRPWLPRSMAERLDYTPGDAKPGRQSKPGVRV